VKYDKATVTMEAPPEAPAAKGEKAKPAAKTPKATAAADAAPVKGLGTCPACSEGHIVKGSKAYGCIRFKEGCRFLIPIEQQGKAITDKQVSALLSKGKTPTIKGFKDEEGNSYDAALKFDSKGQVVVERVEKAEKAPAADPFAKCPRCQQGAMLKGKSAYGCSRFREGCQFVVPFEMGGKQLTDKQIGTLLTKRKTTKIKGFTSAKTGNSFDAALAINDSWQVIYQFD
jgi:DNA topoisomerase III